MGFFIVPLLMTMSLIKISQAKEDIDLLAYRILELEI